VIEDAVRTQEEKGEDGEAQKEEKDAERSP